jgi:hypothetical protein
VSRRIRSFLACLAVSAVLPLVLPGVASGTPHATTSAGKVSEASAGTSGIPTRFAGGCDSPHHTLHHTQPSPLTDLQRHT